MLTPQKKEPTTWSTPLRDCLINNRLTREVSPRLSVHSPQHRSEYDVPGRIEMQCFILMSFLFYGRFAISPTSCATIECSSGSKRGEVKQSTHSGRGSRMVMRIHRSQQFLPQWMHCCNAPSSVFSPHRSHVLISSCSSMIFLWPGVYPGRAPLLTNNLEMHLVLSQADRSHLLSR